MTAFIFESIEMIKKGKKEEYNNGNLLKLLSRISYLEEENQRLTQRLNKLPVVATSMEKVNRGTTMKQNVMKMNEKPCLCKSEDFLKNIRHKIVSLEEEMLFRESKQNRIKEETFLTLKKCELAKETLLNKVSELEKDAQNMAENFKINEELRSKLAQYESELTTVSLQLEEERTDGLLKQQKIEDEKAKYLEREQLLCQTNAELKCVKENVIRLTKSLEEEKNKHNNVLLKEEETRKCLEDNLISVQLENEKLQVTLQQMKQQQQQQQQTVNDLCNVEQKWKQELKQKELVMEELDTCKQRLDMRQRQIAELTAQSLHQTSEGEAVEQKLVRTRNQLADLRSQLIENAKQLKEKTLEADQLVDHVGQYESSLALEIEKNEKLVLELNNEKQQRRQEVQKWEANLESLQWKLKQKSNEVEALKVNCDALRSEVTLITERSEKEKEALLEEHKHTLQLSKDTLTVSFDEKVSEYCKKINTTKDINDFLEKELAKSKESIVQSNKELTVVKEALAEQEKKTSNIKATAANAKKQLKEINTVLDEKNQEILKHEQLKENYEQEISAIKVVVKDREQEIEELQKKVEEVKQEGMRSRKSEENYRIVELERTLLLRESSLIEMQQELGKLKQELGVRVQENGSQQDELQLLRDCVSRQQNEILQKSRELDQLQQNDRDHVQLLEERWQTLKQLESELTTKLHQATSNVDQMKKAELATQAFLEKEISKKNDEITMCAAKFKQECAVILSEKDAEVKRLLREKDQEIMLASAAKEKEMILLLKQKNEEKQCALDEKEQEVQNVVLKKEKEKDMLSKELQNCKSDIAAVENSNKQLRAELDRMQGSIKELVQRVKDRDQQLSKEQELASRAESKLVAKETQLTRLRQRYAQLIQENVSKEEMLSKELKEAKNETIQLENQYKKESLLVEQEMKGLRLRLEERMKEAEDSKLRSWDRSELAAELQDRLAEAEVTLADQQRVTRVQAAVIGRLIHINTTGDNFNEKGKLLNTESDVATLQLVESARSRDNESEADDLSSPSSCHVYSELPLSDLLAKLERKYLFCSPPNSPSS